MKKEIKITGLDGLKTMPFEKFVDFQGKLKKPIEKAQLEKLKNSIIKHGIFVPKFVWFDDSGQALTVDGHQTLSALRGLHEDGYAIPAIPFVEIDAQGAKDAAEKLLQINSRYAEIDPEGALEWMQDYLDFEQPDIKEMIESINIPELKEIEFNDFDFDDLDDENEELSGMEDIDIKITMPKKYSDKAIEWLANGESKTSTGMGKGIIKRCGLLL